MSDLFSGDHAPGSPRPWSTADGFLQSEPWRAYCEAWGYLTDDARDWHLREVTKRRGAAAGASLVANIETARLDVAGKIKPRNKLFTLIR